MATLIKLPNWNWWIIGLNSSSAYIFAISIENSNFGSHNLANSIRPHSNNSCFNCIIVSIESDSFSAKLSSVYSSSRKNALSLINWFVVKLFVIKRSLLIWLFSFCKSAYWLLYSSIVRCLISIAVSKELKTKVTG